MNQETSARFERLEGIVAGLLEVVAEHENDRVAMRESIDKLRLADEKTDEQLGVLIRIMDEWIRSNSGNGKGRKRRPQGPALAQRLGFPLLLLAGYRLNDPGAPTGNERLAVRLFL